MAQKFKAKTQKVIDGLTAYLIQNDVEISSPIKVKLEILESLFNDYLNAEDYIRKNGYITTFNKGTSVGLNPIIKLKYESVKQIRKILKEIQPKEEAENIEDFINSLTTE